MDEAEFPQPRTQVDLNPDVGNDLQLVQVPCDSGQQRGPYGCMPKPDKCPEGKDNCPKKAELDMDELLAITCPCGFGYYTFDRKWVSGADVRAGLAPPRPGMMVIPPVEVVDPAGDQI